MGVKPRIEKPLGSDYLLAIQAWAALEQASVPQGSVITLGDAANRYVADELPKKSARTQRDYLADLVVLRVFFNDAPLTEIKPLFIRQYLRWRVEKRDRKSTRLNS